jgi:uncharacterized protein YecE (DUF72 family)
MKKLKDVEAPLANFFAQGILALKDKLGPILWQFPPGFAFNAERFETFFQLLPRDHTSAAKLARKHDARMKGRTYFNVAKNHKLRHAVEIRHESFRSPEFVKLLRKHDVALVVADTAGKWPFFEDVTSDFVYARLHGDEQIYVSGYTPSALDRWAERVTAWREGKQIKESICVLDQPPPKRKSRDVYVYFDNDVKVRAPFDAIGLAQRVGGFVPEHPPGKAPDELDGEARESWPVIRRKAR